MTTEAIVSDSQTTMEPQPPPPKRQKREDYRNTPGEAPTGLPKKRFYRQRAHANPFSDHNLT